MTAAEVRRAMWLSPVAVGTAALGGGVRIGVAAIQETLPLWLAGMLGVVVLVWCVAAARQARRRYRARLLELTQMSDVGLLREPVRPLPLGVRAWLLAAPVLAVAALLIAATTPGVGSTCAARGISTAAAREGTCLRRANLFGQGVTYQVVDVGHLLYMPGLDAQLLATRMQSVVITNPQRDPGFYPDGTGTLVCFEIAITNRGPVPLTYDATGSNVDLLLQDVHSAKRGYQLPDMPRVGNEPIPALADHSPIPPGQTAVGWVAFDAPQWAPKTLTSRATDLEFTLPTNGNSANPYVGQIRLWKAANAAGARALTNHLTP